MSTSRTLITDFVRQHRTLVTGVLIVLMCSNLLNVLLPLSIGLFYEAGLKENSLKGQLLQRFFPFIDTADRFFGLFGGLVLLRALLFFAEKYGVGVLGERFSLSLRTHVFRHQMQMSTTAYRSRPSGKYLLRYSGDLNAIREFVNRGILLFTGDLFFLTGAFIALFMVQAHFTALVLGVWVGAAILVFGLSRRLRYTTLDRRGQRSKGLGFVSDRLQAFYTVKSFNREKTETARYDRENKRLFRVGLRFYRFSAFIQALFPLAFYATLGLVLWMALAESGADVRHNGQLFAFVLLLLHMHTVLQRVLEVNLVWQSGTASLSKLSKLLNQPIEERVTHDLTDKIQGRISFHQLSFSYPNGKSVFQSFEGMVESNAITVLQGKHGTGKSTLLKLIQKIYEPQGGRILLDDIDLALLSPFEVRKKISIVSPEAPLLGNTVFEAITYNENPDKREKALELFKKLNFRLAESEEETLDFKLEEQARNLSSGEIALLQLVRALLTDKKILLLDEPFASLDSRQTSRVSRLLNRLKARHTILIIAKRPPSRLEADYFISLDPQHESEESTVDLDGSNNDF